MHIHSVQQTWFRGCVFLVCIATASLIVPSSADAAEPWGYGALGMDIARVSYSVDTPKLENGVTSTNTTWPIMTAMSFDDNRYRRLNARALTAGLMSFLGVGGLSVSDGGNGRARHHTSIIGGFEYGGSYAQDDGGFFGVGILMDIIGSGIGPAVLSGSWTAGGYIGIDLGVAAHRVYRFGDSLGVKPGAGLGITGVPQGVNGAESWWGGFVWGEIEAYYKLTSVFGVFASLRQDFRRYTGPRVGDGDGDDDSAMTGSITTFTVAVGLHSFDFFGSD